MVKFFDSVSDSLRDWALEQQVFFIASAPRHGKHVNISPKGLPSSTFTLLDPNTACYIDATGSGAETISHIYETNRATVMFCSFDKSPRIMRFFCTGRVVELDEPEFPILLEKMGKDDVEGARAVIVLHIFKVQTSCGYGVPLLSNLPDPDLPDPTPPNNLPKLLDRKTLGHWASQTINQNRMESYRALNNARNLDGLPALKAARRSRGENLWWGDVVVYLSGLGAQWDAVLVGVLLGVLGMVVVGSLGVGFLFVSL